MPCLIRVRVLGQQLVAPECYRMSLFSPEISCLARPGQFLYVRCGQTLDPLLRRPFSVHAVDREKGEVFLLYRVVGKGTALLAQKRPGDYLDVVGPLGNGFTLPAVGQSVAVVAGGIGVAPLFFLLQELTKQSQRVYVLLGASTAGQLLLVSEIEKLEPAGIRVATDDGSKGHHGTVTELVEGLLSERMADLVYACGPPGMLENVTHILKAYNIKGEVSLEERMGCGIGACLSCVYKTRKGKEFYYSRVCLEGPVFKTENLIIQLKEEPAL